MSPENYTWYPIFNRLEFQSEVLISKTLTLNLTGRGETEVLIVQGVGIGVVVENTYLRVNLNTRNPFYFEGYAIYQNADQDIFLGFLNED